MPKNKNKKLPIRKILTATFGVIFLVAAIWLGRYSLRQYDEGQAELGIVVCNDSECIKTIHIHSDIEFDLCGEGYVLPRESGPLDGLHTHKERNYLHFHDEVKLDYETREQFPDKRLSIQEVIDIFELGAEEFCGKSDVTVEVVVNGQPQPLSYNWVDGDDIQLTFK